MKYYFDKTLGFFISMKPKHYNGITTAIVTAGLGIMGQPLWLSILIFFFPKHDFSVFQNLHPFYGIILIIVGLIYNYSCLKHENKIIYDSTNKNNVKDFDIIPSNDFYELCELLIPLFDENDYIFKTYGPNSSANSEGELRTNLTLWESTKQDYLVPNNKIIQELIKTNKHLIPREYIDTFDKLDNHIYAFQKHVENKSIDYSDFQFPKNITSIIKDFAYSQNINNSTTKTQIEFIKTNLKKTYFNEGYVFGSAVFTTNKNKDFDIVCILKINDNDSLLNFKKEIEKLNKTFKKKYSKPLHFTVFTENENNQYLAFLDKNNHKIKI